MLEVSPGFKEAVKAPARESSAVAIIHLNAKAKPSICSVTEGTTTYEAPDLVRGFLSDYDITYVGDLCPPDLRDAYVAWKSRTTSDATGTFTEPPVISITYAQTHACKNILIVGNQFDLIKEVNIKIYNGPLLAFEMMLSISAARDGINLPEAVMCTRMEITILSTALPNRPAFLYFIGNPHKLIIERDSFQDISVLEELGSDDLRPYSTVTSNELDISLANIDSLFTPSNKLSPLHGTMVPGIKIEAYVSIATSFPAFEVIPMGEYYTSEWSSPTESVVSNITAHDLLYELLDREIPLIRAVHSETVASLFRRLMIVMDIPLDKIKIRVSKTVPLVFGFYPGKTVGDALDSICEAGMCYVYVDRTGAIVLQDYAYTEPVITMSDHDYILTVNNLERYNSVFKSLSVDIHEPILRRNDRLLDGYEIVIEPGTTVLDDIEFSNSPVVLLNSVSKNEATSAIIKDVDYGHNKLRITINNYMPTNQLAKLSASATYLDAIKRTRSIDGNTVSRSVLKVTNPLIQTSEHADMFNNSMKESITDPFSLFELDTRGNPSIELGDIIVANVPSSKVVNEVIEIRRAKYDFDGGLTCIYTGRRVTNG